jgi:hypothetical protein
MPTSNERQERLLRRIEGEFLEMPGLRLTCTQAQRLLGVDAETCANLLEILVDRQFLACSADGRYRRTADGPSGQSAAVRRRAANY